MSGRMGTSLLCCILLVVHVTGVIDDVEIVSVEQLLQGTRLPDGDIVRLTEVEVGDPDTITVELHLGAAVSNWKAIELHGKHAYIYSTLLVKVQDTHTPVQASFPAGYLSLNYLMLHKANTLGTHIAIYKIGDAEERMTGGHLYKFSWDSD